MKRKNLDSCPVSHSGERTRLRGPGRNCRWLQCWIVFISEYSFPIAHEDQNVMWGWCGDFVGRERASPSSYSVPYLAD